MKKVLAALLCVAFVISLVACGKNTQGESGVEKTPTKQETKATETTKAPTEPTSAKQEATLPKEENAKIADPEDGTVLNVDIAARGEIKSNAPAMGSGEFILEGKTMQMPLSGAALANEGWHFSDNNTAKDAKLKPNTKTNLISFYIYDADGNEMMLEEAVNNSDTEKTVLECDITKFSIDLFGLSDTFADLILPGGICLYSKAADVIEVFGMPENNSNFESVEVYEDGIRYVEHKESGLCYYFSFYSSEDYNGEANGHIRKIKISMD